MSRSSSAVVIFASPNTLAHSLKLRLVVMTTLVRSYSLDSRWNSSAPMGAHRPKRAGHPDAAHRDSQRTFAHLASLLGEGSTVLGSSEAVSDRVRELRFDDLWNIKTLRK